MLDAIHRLLAYAAVAGTAVGIAWAIALAVQQRTGGPAFERLQAAIVSLLIVAAASGITLLLVGARPAESLHLVYAGVVVGLIPLARSYVGRLGGRGAGVLVAAAFLALGGLLYRLFTTG